MLMVYLLCSGRHNKMISWTSVIRLQTESIHNNCTLSPQYQPGRNSIVFAWLQIQHTKLFHLQESLCLYTLADPLISPFHLHGDLPPTPALSTMFNETQLQCRSSQIVAFKWMGYLLVFSDNITINHILPKKRFFGLHFYRNSMGLTSTTLTCLAPKATEVGELTQNNSRYAIQGHRFWYQ